MARYQRILVVPLTFMLNTAFLATGSAHFSIDAHAAFSRHSHHEHSRTQQEQQPPKSVMRREPPNEEVPKASNSPPNSPHFGAHEAERAASSAGLLRGEGQIKTTKLTQRAQSILLEHKSAAEEKNDIGKQVAGTHSKEHKKEPRTTDDDDEEETSSENDDQPKSIYVADDASTDEKQGSVDPDTTEDEKTDDAMRAKLQAEKGELKLASEANEAKAADTNSDNEEKDDVELAADRESEVANTDADAKSDKESSEAAKDANEGEDEKQNVVDEKVKDAEEVEDTNIGKEIVDAAEDASSDNGSDKKQGEDLVGDEKKDDTEESKAKPADSDDEDSGRGTDNQGEAEKAAQKGDAAITATENLEDSQPEKGEGEEENDDEYYKLFPEEKEVEESKKSTKEEKEQDIEDVTPTGEGEANQEVVEEEQEPESNQDKAFPIKVPSADGKQLCLTQELDDHAKVTAKPCKKAVTDDQQWYWSGSKLKNLVSEEKCLGFPRKSQAISKPGALFQDIKLQGNYLTMAFSCSDSHGALRWSVDDLGRLKSMFDDRCMAINEGTGYNAMVLPCDIKTNKEEA